QVHAEGGQCRVRLLQARRHLVAGHPGGPWRLGCLAARAVEAAHLHLDLPGEHRRELGHVHPRPTVDVWRVLAGEQVHAHTALHPSGDGPRTGAVRSRCVDPTFHTDGVDPTLTLWFLP